MKNKSSIGPTALRWGVVIGWLAITALIPAAAAQDAESCLDCHNDPDMVSDDNRPVGVAGDLYVSSVHGDLDCTDCHSAEADYDDTPHYSRYTPVDCAECHEEAVHSFRLNAHAKSGNPAAPTCASCHGESGNAHQLRAVDSSIAENACRSCHDGQAKLFAGSIHEDLFADGEMKCLTCHLMHKSEAQLADFDPGCDECHQDVEARYEVGAHRLGRQHGNDNAAMCADCHDSHHVLAATDMTSPTHRRNISALCGKCHGQEGVITDKFVRLPVSLPSYLESVHGEGWTKGETNTATCTDCHGVHEIRHAADEKATIHRTRVADTCGKCHEDVSEEYKHSIHGEAVALGIMDAPTCSDCHEHLIRHPDDPGARVSPHRRAREVCGDCHMDHDLAVRYGMSGNVVESYFDSYHGWAVNRGSSLAATCTDCHNVHDVRSTLDPQSSVHPSNVVTTCARCHEKSNEKFALSYTHQSAVSARGRHGWVRLIYLGLIAFVLGGMALHNSIVARYELGEHFQRRRSQPYVLRWLKSERAQHLILLLSFTGLAITGFALRYPDAWWAKLIALGTHEYIRSIAHRVLACIMVAVSLYHTYWLIFTKRGRLDIREMRPGFADVIQFLQNMAFHLRMRAERPAFGRFDYTQKAEYWAVIWGTVLMAITGFILWFPAPATGWLPSWVVRVSEVIHFYEAILAVSAIVIWHLFYVIFLPSEYPVSTIWLNGRQPAAEWKETHRGEFEERGPAAIEYPGASDSDGERKRDPEIV